MTGDSAILDTGLMIKTGLQFLKSMIFTYYGFCNFLWHFAKMGQCISYLGTRSLEVAYKICQFVWQEKTSRAIAPMDKHLAIVSVFFKFQSLKLHMNDMADTDRTAKRKWTDNGDEFLDTDCK